MATPPDDTGLEFDGDGDTHVEFDPSKYERYAGYRPQGLPVINSPRAKSMGYRRESDRKSFAWWRIASLNNPMIFADFYKDRLENLSLAAFNKKQAEEAAKKGDPTPPAVNMGQVQTAIGLIKGLIEEIETTDPTQLATNDAVKKAIIEKVNALHAFFNQDAANKQLFKFIQVSLNLQYGREIRGYNKDRNATEGLIEEGSLRAMLFGKTAPGDPTYQSAEHYKDIFGMYSMLETLHTLEATTFFDGISLKKDAKDKHNYSITTTDVDGKETSLVDCHVEEVKDRNSSMKCYESAYSLNPNLPPEQMDKAVVALGEVIASHRQVCDFDTSNIRTIEDNFKDPLLVMRLIDELVCARHIQVDISKIRDKMDQMLADPNPNPYPQEVIAHWKLQKENLCFMYNKRSPNMFDRLPQDMIDRIELAASSVPGAPPMQGAIPSVRLERMPNGTLKSTPFNRFLVNKYLHAPILDPANDIYKDAYVARYPGPSARRRASTSSTI